MLKTILNLFKLENRVVLDAAAAGHIADHHDRHQDAYHSTETYSDHTAGDQKEHIGESVARAAALLSSPQASAEPTDVVLVSDSLPEYQTLVAAVRPEAIVIVYDADKDSAADIIDKITQVSEAAGKPIDSVTVLSHGDEGSFQLGKDTVTSDNAATFGTLENVLSDDARIYIFGCNVSDASGKGQALLDTLATATGAKVFASDDASGNGGDWVLEASSQNAANTSAEPPIDTGKLAGYSGTLASPTIDLDANDGSGATGSDFRTSFTEGQKTVGITDTDLTISDAQNGIIKSATITLTNPTDRSAEALVADTGNLNIKQTYNAATGVLTLEGLDTVENYQTVLRTVQYSNTSEDPATQERVITFTVQDSGGNTSAVATSRVAITAVNNAPVVTLPGGGLPYGDDAGVVLLNKNAFVSDVDSRDFNGGVMTVKFTAGADAYDKISIQNGGDGGKITVSGNEVLYQGQVIATFSGGTSSVPLSFTLNDHANPVTVQSLVRSLTYENTATIPTQVNRKVEIVVTDGDGGTSAPDTQEISLNSVNDDPVNTVPGIQTILEGQSITFSKDNGTTIAIWDVDASTGTLQVNVNVIHGTLTVADGSGATVTNNNSLSVSIVGTVDQINAALNGMTYQPSTTDWYGDDTLTITTDDQGNTGSGGAKRDTDTVGIKVLALNDAPVNYVPTGQTTSVDTDLIFSNVNSNRITVGDPDAGASAIQVTLSVEHGTLSLGTVADLTVSGNNTASVTITGEISKINQALDGMKYKPSSGWNGTDSLKVVTDDKGNTGQGGAKAAESTIDIAVVPKTPFNVGFTEGDSPVQIADGLTVSGVTSGVIKSAQITILNSQEADKTVEVLTASTSSQYNIKQTYNAATGVLTLEGIDSVEHYQAVLRSITYNNTSSNPNPLARTITIQITPSDDTTRNISSTTLNVTAVNNPPTLTLPGGTFNYIGTDAVLVNKNAFVSDVDSLNFDTGKLTVSFSSGSTATDRLGINSEGTGAGQIGVSGNQITYGGVVIATFSGGTDGSTPLVFNFNANATPDNVQALVRNITYTNTTRNPAIQERDIQFVVTDGDGGTSTPQTQVINVLDYNEPPANTVPGPQEIDENSPTGLVFSPANSTTISISDPDAEDKSMQVLLSVQNGTLTVAASSGLTVTGDGTGSVILVGSQTQINSALNGLLYRPLANWSGNDTLSINTNDLGNTGLGGAQNALSGVAIYVRSVNDPPVNHLPESQVVKENSTLSFRDITSNQISVSDPDAGNDSIEVKLDVTQGTLSIGTVSGVAITGNNGKNIVLTGSQSAINTALNTLTYTPPADYIGNDTLTMTTNDNGHTGDIGGAQIVANTLAIVVSPPLDKLTYFVEGKGAVNISPDGTIIEGVTIGIISSAKITLVNPIDDVVNYKGNDEVEKLPAEILKATIDPAQNYNIQQSYDATTGVLTLTGLDTVANYEKILHQIYYNNISEDPTKPQRIFTFEITDASGTVIQLSATTGAYVVPADNAPFIRLGTKVIFAEGEGSSLGEAVVVDEFYAKLDGIIDVDSPDFDGGFLEVKLSGATSADDSLVILQDADIQTSTKTITDSDGNNKIINIIIYKGVEIGTFEAYTPEKGLVITFNANTKADATTGKLEAVQAVMDNITYQNMNLDNPTHHGNLTITYTLNDGDSIDSYAADGKPYPGIGANESSSAKPLEIIAINDKPVNLFNGKDAGFPTEDTPLSTQKDTPVVFSDANGNRITISDVDANNGQVQVTLTVDHSTLSLDMSNTLILNKSVVVTDNGTAKIILTGTVSDINNVLNGLTYTPTADFVGVAKITILTDDLGNTGAKAEDAPVVFSDVNGNRITISDGNANNDGKIGVTLTVDHSTLSLDTTNTLIQNGSVVVTNNGTANIILKGTVSDINDVLNGLTCTPDGIDEITVLINNTVVQTVPVYIDMPGSKQTDTDYIYVKVSPPPTPHRNEGGNPIPWTPPEGVVNPPAIHPEAGWGPPIQFPGPVEPNGPFFAYGRGLYGNPCGDAPLYPCCTLEEALRIGCRFAPAINPEARACNITWEWMESIGWNVPYGWHGDYIEEEYDLYHGLFLRETGDKGFNVGAGEFAESFRAVEEALDALRIRNEEYDVYYTLFLKGPGGESFNDFGPGELKQVFYNGREQLDKSAEWCPAGEPYKQMQQG